MTRVRWAMPEWHETIGSTNAEALAGPRPGRVVVADHQSAGQGRRGRTWSSPPGTGMAISTVLPPVPAVVRGWVPLVAGLAVVRALADSRWPVDAGLKWPNDVLLVGRRPGKVAGILTQVADDGELVVGVGVNVDHTGDQLPVSTASSWRLARGGAPLPDAARSGLLEDYLRHLAELTAELGAGDMARVATPYRERCRTLGRAVVVHRPGGGATQGVATDVDETGALLLRTRAGTSTHHAGDVGHLRDE